MLNWYIALNHGRKEFEGENFEQVIKDVIEYYATREETPDDISLIAAFDDDGVMVQQADEFKTREIQEQIEEEVSQWIKELEDHRREQVYLRSDYRASLI